MQEAIELLEARIGYSFVNKNLLLTALTHRSYRERVGGNLVQAANYERLEFLGDAVLELVITEYLYLHFEKSEGELTTVRSQMVNRFVLARIGVTLGLHDIVRISDQEKIEVGHARDSIVADSVEALIGAIYLETGYELTKTIVLSIFAQDLDLLNEQEVVKDPKTELQEYTQKNYKTAPLYKTINSKGLDHKKEFECAVYLETRLLATAWGKSKQEAQTECAKLALRILITEVIG